MKKKGKREPKSALERMPTRKLVASIKRDIRKRLKDAGYHIELKDK